MNEIKIVIADDHPVFRAGLRDVIRSHVGIRILAEAGDGNAALECVERELPRVAVLDLDMPGKNGIDVAREILKRKLPVAVIMLTMYDEEDLFQQAMECGVTGYILKDSAVTDIIRGIETVAAGGYFLSPSLSHHVVRDSRRYEAPKDQRLGLHRLTSAERNILRLISQSMSSREIAAELGISERTVENHRSHICAKLNISGSLSLVRFALENKANL